MAVLVKEFIDFETGELKADADPYDFSGAVGASCSLVSSPAPPYDTYTLKIIQHKTSSFFRGPLFTYSSGTTCITSAYLRFGTSNYPPSFPCGNLIAMIDESSNRYWEISLTPAGNLELRDHSDTLLSSLAVTGGAWFRIEVVWEPGNSSGDWAWYGVSAGGFPVLRGGTAAHGGSDSQGNFDPAAGTTDIGILLRGEGGDTDPSPMDTYHGGCYILEGATDIEDRVGGREGKSGDWQSIGAVNGKITKASATPDCDEEGNAGSGDDLTTDLWNDAGDDNLTTSCIYTRSYAAASLGGGVHVAAPASDPSDVVVAAKWLWHGTVSRFRDFRVVYGRYNASSTPQYVVTSEIANSITRFPRYYRKIIDRREPSINYAPRYNDQFVIGMLNSDIGGSIDIDTIFKEGWCYSMHAVPLLTGKPSIGRFGRMWRGKRGRPL